METIHKNILSLIGNTPIVEINKLTSLNDAKIYAKLEWYNIGGSVKDRMAFYLIEDAEKKGILTKEKTILEASSGNTGISLAMIAAMKGYKVKIIMSESVSIERRKIIKAYGAKLVLSSGEKGTAGAVELKEKMVKEGKEKYIDLNQFKNPANIRAHYETTGKEIFKQTSGMVDMVVIGIGTAGTGVGVSLKLKELKKEIKTIGVMPEIGASIQGLRNPKENFPTQLCQENQFDEMIEISKKEIRNIKKIGIGLARKEGLFAGISSAAVMYVAMQKAKEIGKGKIIVVILPDSGTKYLSTDFFSN